MLPLSRFRVLDLTRARSGPTCSASCRFGRQGHQNRGAGGTTAAAADGTAGLPEPAPQQAQHHGEPEAAGGQAVFRPCRQRRRAGGELPARVKHRLGIDYEALTAINPRIVLRLDLRLRPGPGPMRAAGVRPDRPGYGRPHERDRPARPGPAAGRHPGRRPDGRCLHRHRHPGGAAGARAARRGSMGPHLAARGDDRDDGLPGGSLDHGREVPHRPATTTRPRCRPSRSA